MFLQAEILNSYKKKPVHYFYRINNASKFDFGDVLAINTRKEYETKRETQKHNNEKKKTNRQHRDLKKINK